MAERKLQRKEGKLLGVCEGLGEYLDVDPTIVRIAFVLLFFGVGGGLVIYIILALIMPKAY